MRTEISYRITKDMQGRFFTVKLKDGQAINGKLVMSLSLKSNAFLYIARSYDGQIIMVKRRQIAQVNGDKCNVVING